LRLDSARAGVDGGYRAFLSGMADPEGTRVIALRPGCVGENERTMFWLYGKSVLSGFPARNDASTGISL